MHTSHHVAISPTPTLPALNTAISQYLPACLAHRRSVNILCVCSWRNEFWVPGNFLTPERVFQDPSSTKQGSLLTRLYAKPAQSCLKVTLKVTSLSLAHTLDFLSLHSEPSLCHHTNLSFQMSFRLEAGAFLKSIGIWKTRASAEPVETERVDCVSPELRK